MNNVKYSATKLENTGKRGILKPDETGYYNMIIGGLNVFNSAGEYYTLDGAKKLFDESSILMRRIANGNLKGESGHPVQTPGMSDSDYLRRIMRIEEPNVCCHYKEIWLDETYGKNNPQYGNPNLVAVMAKVKPSGPNGPALKESFDNPDENVCFSIRAITYNHYERGKTIRVLTSIYTYDNVVEPGISHATKWNSPSLENLDDRIITRREIEQIIDSDSTIATESNKEIFQEVLKSFNNDKVYSVSTIPPLFTKW